MPVMTITSSILTGVLAILGVPLGVALGLSCTVALLIFQPIPSFEIIPQMMSVVTENFVLTAIPLFILAGPGGLGVANIIGSMVFGGCSGSSLADTACLGSQYFTDCMGCNSRTICSSPSCRRIFARYTYYSITVSSKLLYFP